MGSEDTEDQFAFLNNMNSKERLARKTEVLRKPTTTHIRKKKNSILQSIPKAMAQSEVKIPSSLKDKKLSKSLGKDDHNKSHT